jgi:hypothetical protein
LLGKSLPPVANLGARRSPHIRHSPPFITLHFSCCVQIWRQCICCTPDLCDNFSIHTGRVVGLPLMAQQRPDPRKLGFGDPGHSRVDDRAHQRAPRGHTYRLGGTAERRYFPKWKCRGTY